MSRLHRTASKFLSFVAVAVAAVTGASCGQTSLTVSPTVTVAAPAPPSVATSTIPPPSVQVELFVDSSDCTGIDQELLPVRSLGIARPSGRLTVTVEVADTLESRGRGLMCRTEVPPGTGMVFLWDRPTNGGFWMYKTYVPLDLLYVDGGGQIVAFRTMTPCPRSPGEETPAWTTRCSRESQQYAPGAEYTRAVELPAGWLRAQGFDPYESAAWYVTLE